MAGTKLRLTLLADTGVLGIDPVVDASSIWLRTMAEKKVWNMSPTPDPLLAEVSQ